MAVAANNQSENVLYGIIIQRYNERIWFSQSSWFGCNIKQKIKTLK